MFDDNLLKILQSALVVAGAVLLVMALRQGGRLGARAGFSRPRLWAASLMLVRLFIAGYAGFVAIIALQPLQHAYTLVAAIFLGGGVFVLLVVVASLRSVREIERLAGAAAHDALHDPLTGLPNRTLLNDRLARAVLAAESRGGEVAAMLLDLNRFKEVNDTLGHDSGDELLKQLVPRLLACVRQSDTVARLGGDEFVLVIEGAGVKAATEVAEKIVRQVERAFVIDGHGIELGASVGIAIFPLHGRDAAGLLMMSEVAMYGAKREASGHAVYEARDDAHNIRRLTMASSIRAAIDGGEFEMHYQPKIDVAGRRVVGAEALLRWHHPLMGAVPPDEFVPLAERAGLMKPLTRRVVEMVIAQMRRWDAAGMMLDVSINLSARNLGEPEFPDDLLALAREHGIAPERLTLEITETAMMLNPELSREILSRIGAMGFRVSIDDFGAGYSSLAYIQRLPAREIKIDKSFVKDMTSSEGDAVIVHSTIRMAHNIGYRVVAEGVESEEVLDLLHILECDVAQGFFSGNPMAADNFHRWYEARGIAA